MRGEAFQPSDVDLSRLSEQIRAQKTWEQVFPGVASINLAAVGYGPSVDLRITKNSGIAVHIVPEATPDAIPVAIRRVDELGFYNLSRNQLAKKLNLSGPKTTALIRYLKIQSDPACFREFTIGRSTFQRYSQKALARSQEALESCDMEQVWRDHGIRSRRAG